ncbi:RluA family pseudouridine synthase [Clostridium facile]|uniref:Pseudouridine synthase n=1 Tax=Clostridium facile TaxID=2763035 RepID=A0ABR7INY0_9CLOT|nr:RluA family pseudouridine synthase [Clostridium facile]MBC5786833.1 RluA family pseudouridine synthase [Clostridium facile]
MERIFTTVISQQQDGQTVASILKQLGFSNGMVRRLKRIPNGIQLNGKHAKTPDIAQTGDQLRLVLETADAVSEHIVPVKGELDIVYEDLDLLILNKPAGIPVHPSQGHFEDSLANRVMAYYQNQGLNFVFRAVNRLDRGTSGLMAVAKHSFTQDALCSQMGEKLMQRSYLAIVCGTPQPASGTIRLPIAREEGSTIKRIVSPNGVEAITHYQTIRSNNGCSLLRIQLETGRTHQIRVHFSHLGHPLAGDFLYGTQLPELPQGHALHSEQLKLYHPILRKWMVFTAPLPKPLQQLID